MKSERKRQRGLTRRDALRRVAGLGAAAAVGAGPFILGTKARAAEKIYFASYGGSSGAAMDKVFFKPFTRETGIEVILTPPASVAKLKVAVATRNFEWDAIDWIQSEVETASNLGLLEPIDYSVVNAEDFLFPEARKEHYVARSFYTSGIGYDKRRHAEGKYPRTWAEFWDAKKFPGRRGLRGRPQDTLEMALLAAGTPPSKVYPMDVELAFKMLKEFKPHATLWLEQPSQAVELLKNRELDFSNALMTRIYIANKASIPLGYAQEQQLIFQAPLCVPKGARNAKAAMRLLNYMMDPQKQAENCRTSGSLPIKRKGFAMIAEEFKPWLSDLNSPQHLVVQSEWWGAPGRLEQLTHRFREFMLT